MLNVSRLRLRRPCRPLARRSTSRGAGLIEVLVAILVASLGLLALAGSTAASVRYTKMAQYRATATQLASDIAERARANIVDGVVDPYEVKSKFDDQATLPTKPVTTCRAAADTCAVADIAAMDLYEWRLAARNQLPEGSVYLVKDAAVAGAFDLWIAWRDPSLATNEASTIGAKECHVGLTIDSTTSVRCMYFRVKL
jgi:type IV pilus assembly protein PilV